MDLSTLTIRELFAELTTVEDALQGRTPQTLSPSARRAMEEHQERLCRELRSRTLEDTPASPTPRRRPRARPVTGTVPA